MRYFGYRKLLELGFKSADDVLEMTRSEVARNFTVPACVDTTLYPEHPNKITFTLNENSKSGFNHWQYYEVIT